MKKISVMVTTYNHEKYIASALDSVLMQKGAFELEIIVGDDFSTDSTPSILKEYEKQHPGLMKILPSKSNIGVTRNIQRCIGQYTGDYVAFIEGDDYWTREDKLFNQMQFLEDHPECAFCFNAITLLYEGDGFSIPHPTQVKFMRKRKYLLTTSELIYYNFIGNFSCCMYRKEILERLPPDLFDMFVVDWMFNIYCSQFGKIGFLYDIMSVYRIHEGSLWSSQKNEEKLLSWIKYAGEYDRYLNHKYNKDFEKIRVRIFIMLIYNLSRDYKFLFNPIKYWMKSGLSIREFIHVIFNAFKLRFNIKRG